MQAAEYPRPIATHDRVHDNVGKDLGPHFSSKDKFHYLSKTDDSIDV